MSLFLRLLKQPTQRPSSFLRSFASTSAKNRLVRLCVVSRAQHSQTFDLPVHQYGQLASAAEHPEAPLLRSLLVGSNLLPRLPLRPDELDRVTVSPSSDGGPLTLHLHTHPLAAIASSTVEREVATSERRWDELEAKFSIELARERAERLKDREELIAELRKNREELIAMQQEQRDELYRMWEVLLGSQISGALGHAFVAGIFNGAAAEGLIEQKLAAKMGSLATEGSLTVSDLRATLPPPLHQAPRRDGLLALIKRALRHVASSTGQEHDVASLYLAITSYLQSPTGSSLASAAAIAFGQRDLQRPERTLYAHPAATRAELQSQAAQLLLGQSVAQPEATKLAKKVASLADQWIRILPDAKTET
ncbi:hypothetical protein JCM10207_005086 [Rhodosporidiobolus poonsookiae]